MTSHEALRPSARRLIADIGPVWSDDIPKHRDIVLEVYSSVLRKSPKAGVSVTRDIAYGPHERQVLDCFVPDNANSAQVIVFLHGGNFLRGNRRATDEIYDNVLYWFARQGFVGI